MSSQGSIDPGLAEAESRRMLDSWGEWARSGDIGTGIKPSSIWPKKSSACLYTDEQMLHVDSVIASLPAFPKKVIKRAFLHIDHRGLRSEDIQRAIGEFHQQLSQGL